MYMIETRLRINQEKSLTEEEIKLKEKNKENKTKNLTK